MDDADPGRRFAELRRLVVRLAAAKPSLARALEALRSFLERHEEELASQGWSAAALAETEEPERLWAGLMALRAGRLAGLGPRERVDLALAGFLGRCNAARLAEERLRGTSGRSVSAELLWLVQCRLERLDGSGPSGLSGADLDPAAKLLASAAAFAERRACGDGEREALESLAGEPSRFAAEAVALLREALVLPAPPPPPFAPPPPPAPVEGSALGTSDLEEEKTRARARVDEEARARDEALARAHRAALADQRRQAAQEARRGAEERAREEAKSRRAADERRLAEAVQAAEERLRAQAQSEAERRSAAAGRLREKERRLAERFRLERERLKEEARRGEASRAEELARPASRRPGSFRSRDEGLFDHCREAGLREYHAGRLDAARDYLRRALALRPDARLAAVFALLDEEQEGAAAPSEP